MASFTPPNRRHLHKLQGSLNTIAINDVDQTSIKEQELSKDY